MRQTEDRNIVQTTIRNVCLNMNSKFAMSGKGKCYDHSLTVTFLKSLQPELSWCNRWEPRRQVEGAIFQYIRFNDPRLRHSSLGDKSPLVFERKAA